MLLAILKSQVCSRSIFFNHENYVYMLKDRREYGKWLYKISSYVKLLYAFFTIEIVEFKLSRLKVIYGRATWIIFTLVPLLIGYSKLVVSLVVVDM